MKLPLYFDYAATTPVDPRVAERMAGFLTADGVFGNPASRAHRYGWQAEAAVEEARALVAAALNADPRVMEYFPTVLDRAASDATPRSRSCSQASFAAYAPAVAAVATGAEASRWLAASRSTSMA